MFKKEVNYPPIVPMGRNRYVVDPIATQPFMRNIYGWFDSDITQLVQAQSLQVADNIMNRLEVLKRTSNNGMTDAELLKVLIPRYCQSFGERSKFMEYLQESSPELFKQVVEEKKKDGDPEPSPEPEPEPSE